MALFRSASRFSPVLRQCGRTLAVSQQQNRGYAEMAFTFASPAETLRQIQALLKIGLYCGEFTTAPADFSLVKVFYNKANVKQVDVPSFSGSFGILPEHVPLLAVLQPGVLTVIEEDGVSNKYFVSSGSVTINDDSSVQILAEEAAPLDRLDQHAIREGLAKANQEMQSATTDVAKAEAQISQECFEALSKASE